jgi:endo-1,4-beta-mannosidase
VKFIGELPKPAARIPAAMKAVINKMKATPGEWWEIRKYEGDKGKAAYVYAHNCKRGAIRSLSPQMGIEVKAMSDGDGNVVVVGRYIGTDGRYARNDDDTEA